MSTSIVTTYYDALVARLRTILTSEDGWTRIPNPMDVADNGDAMLRQGWGLAIGSGATRSPMTANYQVDRTFSLVICREVFNTELDADAVAGVGLQIMEDLRLVIKDLETNGTLHAGRGSCYYRGDDGITALTGKQSFYYIKAEFVVRMIEDLNS